ncbi:MAG: hypothetical protein ACXWC4_03360 [Telluria sp.]
MKYWVFEPNLCHFERVCQRAALQNCEAMVLNDGFDVYVALDGGTLKRWRGDESFVVAGVPFEREMFE